MKSIKGFQKGHKINLGKKFPNRKRVVFSAKHKENLSKALVGKIVSNETKRKMKESADAPERKALQSEIGKLSTAKRWRGHIAKPRVEAKGLWTCSKNPKIQLEKKRFRNQRYRARKRNAIGSHTFKEWLALKTYYGNMCLCCKRCEPEIKLTEDHIIPLSKGGSDYIENIQPLCLSCNTRKHTRSMSYLPLGNYYLNYGEKGA